MKPSHYVSIYNVYKFVSIVTYSLPTAICIFHYQVNLETMEMYSPIKGKLRRTHHDGVFVKFALSEKDYSVQAKIGYVQVSTFCSCSVVFLYYCSLIFELWGRTLGKYLYSVYVSKFDSAKGQSN